MKCYAEQQNLTRLDRGTSGAIPICVATLSGFFVGDKMKQLLYHQTEKAKTANRKAVSRYSRTEKGRTVRKLYLQSERGKVAQQRGRTHHYIRYPERWKAKGSIQFAIKSGKLPRSDTLQCHYCPEKAEQYHHHKGYAQKHWLDVIPVCRKCHTKIHTRKERA